MQEDEDRRTFAALDQAALGVIDQMGTLIDQERAARGETTTEINQLETRVGDLEARVREALGIQPIRRDNEE